MNSRVAGSSQTVWSFCFDQTKLPSLCLVNSLAFVPRRTAFRTGTSPTRNMGNPDGDIVKNVGKHQDGDLIEQSKVATNIEHSLGVIEAVKLYPMAVLWATLFAWSLVMVGYDSGIIYSFYALPAFVKKYGTYYGPEIGYEVSTKWQNVLGMGTPVGQFLGAVTASWPMERWGRKKVFWVSLFFTTAWIFLQMFANDIHTLAAGEFLAGIVYGTYVVLAPTYASEVCPLALRGILNAGMNLAYVIGQFVASGVGKGVATRTDQWAYRIPFAVQWTWIPILAIGLYFAPESPWWLVRKGRVEEAEAALRRLAKDSPKVDIKATLANIQATTLHEIEVEKDTTYMECFRGSNRTRTEVAIMVQIWQVITGISLIGYAVYFFELAGLPVSASFDMGVGNTAIGFVATCCSWVFMSFFGRRTIFMYGVAGMAVALFIIGGLDCAPNYSNLRLGAGGAPGHPHFCVPRHRRASQLCHLRRDRGDSSSLADRRFGYEQRIHLPDRHDHRHSVHAECIGGQLEGQDGLLLRRHQYRRRDLVLLPPT